MSLFDAVRDFLVSDDWAYDIPEGKEGQILRTGFTGKNGKFTAIVQVWESRSQFALYTMYPVQVPEDKRPAAAEFIARANYGMIIGNFELDFRDGEVRYKSSVDFEGAAPNPSMIRRVIYSSAVTADKYLPGLMSVVYAGKSPVEAIATVEQGGA